MKLYRVKLKGSPSHGSVDCYTPYILANDPTEAYKKIRKILDEKDYGFESDREMQSIELLADDYEYNECKNLLIV